MVAHAPTTLIELYPHQDECVTATRARIAEGARRIVITAPCAFGKTVVASYIINGALAKGKRSIFVANRRELIRQTFTKLLRMGLPYERIGIAMAGTPARARGSLFGGPLDVCARLRADRKTDKEIDRELWELFAARRPQAPIQVASVDTIRGKELGDFDLVILDECHLATAPSYVALIRRHAPKAVILGLTATPFPTGKKTLGDRVLDGAPLFEALIPPTRTARQLAEAGFLVAPRMYGVPPSLLPNVSGMDTGKDGDWDAGALERATDTRELIGSLVDHWGKRARGLRTALYAAGVRHSQNCVAAFRAAGVRAEHVDGTTDPTVRDDVQLRLDRHEIDLVSNCDLWTTGWDLPSVQALQVARRTKSPIKAHQIMGRGMRPSASAGKEFWVLLDHAAMVAEHGGPLDLEAEDYSIDPLKKKRRRAVAIKTCPQCFAIISAMARVCPEHLADGTPCLYAFGEAIEHEDPEEKDGELVEIPDATRAEKRAYFDELCARRGRERPAWVIRQFTEHFKMRPPLAWAIPGAADEAEAWRELYETGHRKGYKAGWASMRFEEEFAHRPSRAMLAERDAWIDRQGTVEGLEEQLQAAVAAMAPDIVHRDLNTDNMHRVRAPLPPRPREPVLEAWQ